MAVQSRVIVTLKVNPDVIRALERIVTHLDGARAALAELNGVTLAEATEGAPEPAERQTSVGSPAEHPSFDDGPGGAAAEEAKQP